MKVKMLIFILSLISLFLISSCSGNLVDQKENCVAVWYHENNQYSVVIEKGKEFINIKFPSEIPTQIIHDVEEGESLWYETRWWWNSFDGYHHTDISYIKIHVRSIRDINGAGWDHGKFGSGNTILINRE